MNQLTLTECSKRKLDETYLVVYAIFWSNVFEDLKERGVLYMCSDGIAGFKGSLERVYPQKHKAKDA